MIQMVILNSSDATYHHSSEYFIVFMDFSVQILFRLNVMGKSAMSLYKRYYLDSVFTEYNQTARLLAPYFRLICPAEFMALPIFSFPKLVCNPPCSYLRSQETTVIIRW